MKNLPARPRFFRTPALFRAWLEKNFSTITELWIGFYKRSSGKPSITYQEALDQALCFGWIDGLRKSVDPGAYTIRFTPRKPKSQWSAVNIKRVGQLKASGKMQAPGLKAFEGAEDQSRTYSYEQRTAAALDVTMERTFRANAAAWTFFQLQPPWYRRTAIFWVVSAKKPETRQKRLDQLIADSAAGRHIAPLRRPKTVPKRKKTQ